MAEKMRIYIGGLGSNVQERDLKNTFTSPYLGTVESVEIIRSKGRSFGYLDFIPASDKGLAKLFSTYNGCMWKGGKLKLEKAKEDYICRLRREWTEDAELAIKLSSQNSDVDESTRSMQKPNKDQDIDKMQIKLFFPKLRKIKPLPLKGTGKHKYSFQRVEIPPLPVHFCDCEEHSGPPEPVKRNCTDRDETETCGVNEEELDMMKSILSKLLKEEVDYPMAASNQNEFTEEINHDVTPVDTMQVDESEEDQVSDEDNLVINIVGRPNNRVASFEDWGQKTTIRNQDSLLGEPESRTQKLLPDKKRKQPNDIDNIVPSKKKTPNTQPPASTESGSVQLSGGVTSSNKPAWKNLVRKKGATAFHISDILTDVPRLSSDHLASPVKDSQDNRSSKDKELEKVNHLEHSQDDQSNEDEELEKVDHLIDSQDDQSSEDEELEKVDHLEDSQDDQSSEDEELEKVDYFAEPEIDSQDDQASEVEELEKVHLAEAENDSQDNQSSEDEEFEDVNHLGDGQEDQSSEDEELEKVDHLAEPEKDGQDDQSSEDGELEKNHLSELEKDSHDNQSSKDKGLGNMSDAQSAEPSASEDKSGRGAAWLQKSSWLQLVGDANSSAFNLGQILPGVTFEKQELHQFDNNKLSSSKFGKQQKIVHKDRKSPTGDIKKPKAKGDDDIDVGLGNSNMDDSSKEQSHISQSNSDTKQTLEENVSITNKRASIGDIVVSETCPFMRTAASMKEWAKTKAALSGSLKKKGGK